MITIVIIGAGNVAQHLYRTFNTKQDIRVVQCYSRKGTILHPDQSTDTISTDIDQLITADIYIMAISDDAIADVSCSFPFTDRFIVHTSGSVPMDTISTLHRRGVFYPLQTFSTTKEVDFSTIPICIEAENKKDHEILEQLAHTLSSKVYTISSEQRNVLHLAAVYANNFANYMFSIADTICTEHTIPFEILHPLIQETVNKITEMNPDDAQTGPAIRNDQQTIERHLTILTEDSQKKLYTILTQSIQEKHGKKL